jgi:hypothetical protein
MTVAVCFESAGTVMNLSAIEVWTSDRCVGYDRYSILTHVMDPEPCSPPPPPPSPPNQLSKKAQKKAAKAAYYASQKLERRAREKEKKKEKKRVLAEKRAGGELLAEDVARGKKRAKTAPADRFGARVVIDLGFDEYMTDKVEFLILFNKTSISFFVSYIVTNIKVSYLTPISLSFRKSFLCVLSWLIHTALTEGLLSLFPYSTPH